MEHRPLTTAWTPPWALEKESHGDKAELEELSGTRGTNFKNGPLDSWGGVGVSQPLSGTSSGLGNVAMGC